jgi:hypothetical protein
MKYDFMARIGVVTSADGPPDYQSFPIVLETSDESFSKGHYSFFVSFQIIIRLMVQ